MTEYALEAVIADTSAARRLHYQLRYQVFCLEMGFEDPSNYPEGEEKDEFDQRAVHFLVRDTESDTWLAAARLITPGDDPLPIEIRCEVTRDQAMAIHSFDLEATAEVSRLLMMQQVRRRTVDLNVIRLGGPPRRVPPKPAAQEERRRSPVVFQTLLLAIAAYCRELGIPHTAFFGTAALLRILRRMGIDLKLIGDPCVHRGYRIPAVADIDQVYLALSRPDESGTPGKLPVRPYRAFSELGRRASSAGPLVGFPMMKAASI